MVFEAAEQEKGGQVENGRKRAETILVYSSPFPYYLLNCLEELVRWVEVLGL